jgi:K+-transporting ATPase c subunit
MVHGSQFMVHGGRVLGSQFMVHGFRKRQRFGGRPSLNHELSQGREASSYALTEKVARRESATLLAVPPTMNHEPGTTNSSAMNHEP